MPVQISLFTSKRDWWHRIDRGTMPTTDLLPLDAPFKSGRATLLSTGDGFVSGIAHGSRRGAASSFENNVTFERIYAVSPIPMVPLLMAIRPRAREAARVIYESGFGLLSETASLDVRAWLGANEPETSRLLEEILGAEPEWMQSSELGALHRMERDAVNLALEIAGFDRVEALSNYSMPAAPANFSIEELRTAGEDALIIDDLSVFPGWEPVRALFPAGRVFEDPATRRRLTIVHANRNGIELTTGVDLLYFIHDYMAFVLVQYKVARREGRHVLVRIDGQFETEIRRMTELEAKFRSSSSKAPSTLRDHRLSDEICFLKLCEAYQPGEVADLCRGKYIDLKTWELMDQMALTQGRRGRPLRYDEVVRYLHNTAFAELVSEGWVGSLSVQFDGLLEYIMERYEGGKFLILGSLSLGESLRRSPSGYRPLITRPVH